MAELNQLEHKISNADWVITGEGKFDQQTLSGKTVFGVSQIAKAHNVPVIVIAGTLGEDYQALYEHGVSAAFSLANGPITLEHACEHAAELIYERTVDIARLIQFSQTSLNAKKSNRLILKDSLQLSRISSLRFDWSGHARDNAIAPTD